MDAIKTWLSSLTQAQRSKLLLALAALAAVGYWLANQPNAPEVLEETSTPISYSGVVKVHVVGEVSVPGLYELQLGSRVEDAIDAAGGFLQEAVQHSVNLARTLSDGEQIVVLGGDDLADGESGGLISINRADLDQLDKLPGVGPSLAARILDLRGQLGSFSDIRQLREVSGIGEKLFANIKDLVTL
jgi:competence protein ComEA